MFIGNQELRRLILEENLVTGYIDLEQQLQPNGFDLTVEKIEAFDGKGRITKDGKTLSPMEELETIEDIDLLTLDKKNIWALPQGSYLMYFNETINLPKNLAAIHIQRSTVMRCGNFSIVGSWDSGYNGKGCSLLVIGNEDGLILEKDARVVQMHFIRVEGEHTLYDGNYQKENLEKSI
jgi:dUTP pyrophosphatase